MATNFQVFQAPQLPLKTHGIRHFAILRLTISSPSSNQFSILTANPGVKFRNQEWYVASTPTGPQLLVLHPQVAQVPGGKGEYLLPPLFPWDISAPKKKSANQKKNPLRFKDFVGCKNGVFQRHVADLTGYQGFRSLLYIGRSCLKLPCWGHPWWLLRGVKKAVVMLL